jgi:hypothetical protein
MAMSNGDGHYLILFVFIKSFKQHTLNRIFSNSAALDRQLFEWALLSRSSFFELLSV